MLENYLITDDKNVREAIEFLDVNNKRAIFIVGEDKTLLGIFTNGDMRRYILKNGDLSAPITEAMNPNPIVFHSYEEAESHSKKNSMVVYPIVDVNHRLVNAIFERHEKDNGIINDELSDIPLVIMAGGKGTRLYPYTKILPKALIPIGDSTISERIINNFKKFGCKKIYFILNHKANMIKTYFNDLEKDYEVEYFEEKEFLGTGGGLSLLKDKINSTFILSNCDILVNDDLACVLKTHKMKKNKITIVGAMKNLVVPYGVISSDESGIIKSMEEKPQFSFLTNTGVYVIEPEVVKELKEGEFIHLPDIAKRYMDKGDNIGVFPISEKSWLDMGQFSELETMMKEFGLEL